MPEHYNQSMFINNASASLLTLNIPEDVLFRRRSVKDIQSHCVHTILLNNVLRIEAVMLRLAHLFKSHLNTTAATGNWLFTWKKKDSEISSCWKKTSELLKTFSCICVNDQNNVFSQQWSGFMLCTDCHDINTGSSSTTIYSEGKWELHKKKWSMYTTQKSRGFNFFVTTAFPIDLIYLSNKVRPRIFDHRGSYERQSLAVIWKNL